EATATLDGPAAAAERLATPVRGTPLGSLYRLLVLFLVAGLVIAPLIATVLGGLKDLGELRVDAFGLPRGWHWENYWNVLTDWTRYWQFLINSLWVAILTVALTLAVSAPAAFAFAHLKFLGDRFLFNYLILGLTFPFATAILPLFIKV